MTTPSQQDAPTIGGAIAHLSGVSRPQDEYGARPSERDDMSDAQLLEMGVEPDSDPSAKLVWVFVALVALLIGVGLAVGEFFDHFARRMTAETSHALVATNIDELRAAGRQQLEAAEAVDASKRTYRIPISEAIDAIIENPRLLQKHPLGVPDETSQPPAPAAPTAVVPVLIAPTDAAAAPQGNPATLQLAPPQLGGQPVRPSLAPAGERLELRPVGQ